MSATRNKQNLKIKELLIEVNSSDLKRVKKGIKALKTHGNTTVIEPLLNVALSTKNKEISDEIWNFMNDLSDSSSTNEVMQCLKKDEMKALRTNILRSMWNSKLDYSEYLDDITKIAAESDFLTAFECYTILDNLKGPFDEAKVIEAQLVLATSAEKNDTDEQKKHIISDLVLLLKNMERFMD